MKCESYKYQIIGNILLIRETDGTMGSYQEAWEIVEEIRKETVLRGEIIVLVKDNIKSILREPGIWFELCEKGWLFLSTKDPIEAINVTKAKYGL